MVGIQAPLDWLIGEIFWAGKGGEDPPEASHSKHFTGQPEAQPEPQGPAVEDDRHVGVSCVCLCCGGGVGWGCHSCMGGIEGLRFGLPETSQVSPSPQVSQPL